MEALSDVLKQQSVNVTVMVGSFRALVKQRSTYVGFSDRLHFHLLEVAFNEGFHRRHCYCVHYCYCCCGALVCIVVARRRLWAV